MKRYAEIILKPVFKYPVIFLASLGIVNCSYVKELGKEIDGDEEFPEFCLPDARTDVENLKKLSPIGQIAYELSHEYIAKNESDVPLFDSLATNYYISNYGDFLKAFDINHSLETAIIYTKLIDCGMEETADRIYGNANDSTTAEEMENMKRRISHLGGINVGMNVQIKVNANTMKRELKEINDKKKETIQPPVHPPILLPRKKINKKFV